MNARTITAVLALTKGMYTKVWDQETNSLQCSKAFGLCDGQCGNDEAAHNGGWYNAKGEKLGWGDLSFPQLLRISQEIPEGEVFYVLPESASHWDFVRWSKEKNDISYSIAPDAQTPGVEYMHEKCRWVITRGRILEMVDSFYTDDRLGMHTYKDVTYASIKRKELKDYL